LPVLISLSAREASLFQIKTGVGNAMKRTFKPVIGHPVVLELALGQIKLYVSGTILKDCGKSLLMKPETGPDVEIPRDYIMNIETPNRWIQPSIKFL